MTEKSNKKSLIVVTTGGSGGHIFPAEAISSALLKKGFEVVFVTDKRGQVFQGLKNVKTYRLLAEHVTGRSFFHKTMALIKLYFGAVQALFLLRKLQPALVIGVGGYASLPAVIAAQLWHIPVVLHEQNAVLGRANRVLAPNARVIATSFNPTMRVPQKIPAVWVGLPVRSQVLTQEKVPYPDLKQEFRLLIFGGSQGARFFATDLLKALVLLPEDVKKKISVCQQVRAENKVEAEAFYRSSGFKSYRLATFFDNMPELIASAHLVIGRGGASTISEAAVIGRPAIIVPLPTAADDHQTENARLFCDAGAGWMVAEKAFDPVSFSKRLTQLVQDPDLLKQAALNALSLAKPDAADRVADLVQDLVKGA